MNAPASSVTVTAIAALIIPFIERRFGVRLEMEDAAALVTVALGLWHGGVAAFNRWVVPVLDARTAAAQALAHEATAPEIRPPMPPAR
jgi:hypothetical protein